MTNRSIHEKVLSTLRCEDGCQRLAALAELREGVPAEALEVLVLLLSSPEQSIRRRAGGAVSFFKMGGVSLEPKVEVLAGHLQHHADERVRLSCAIHLMSVHIPSVDRAYCHALADPFEKVAQIACLEVGDRGGAEGTAALCAMLGHPSWRVRLEACKALITQKTADQRVVSTLDAMSREPEAAAYDAEVEESKECLEEFAKAFTPEGTAVENWGKLDTIVAKARRVADQGSA